jgi:hypothetical protein
VRDDQDVAVGEVLGGRVREQAGQIVAGPDVGDPGEREERELQGALDLERLRGA